MVAIQRGATDLAKFRNDVVEEEEEEEYREPKKVKMKKKPSVPKKSADEYMAYLSMQGGARFGL